MTKKEFKKKRRKILGVNVDFGMTVDDVLEHIEGLIVRGEGNHLVSTTSPYFIMSAQEDTEFKEIVNNAELSVPDGVGVLYANYYLNKISKLKKGASFPVKAFFSGLLSGIEGFIKKKEFGKTITGVNLTYKLSELSARKGYTVFLLGGSRRDNKGHRVEDKDYDMASVTANELKSLYPNLRIIGATSHFSKQSNDDNNTLSYIHNCMNKYNVRHIDILLVAYNPIQQEKWILRNANKIPARISIGIGRTFNYISNDMKQPSIMYEKMHLSWLYTLIRQPWRVKRVLMTFPAFPLKVYIESLKA